MSTITFAEIAPATAPRSEVSLLVATRADGAIAQTRFAELPRLLRPGDLLVVNTSATLPAALPGILDGAAVRVHLSTPLGADRWVVELRTEELGPLRPSPVAGVVVLPGGGRLTLAGAYLGSERLREADLVLPGGTAAYLDRHGAPIRYGYLHQAWPIEAYQTIFAREPGSAEMPSAGRPFTDELVTELVSRGVLVAPVTLHCGVSSLEAGESPYPERYRVPPETARLVNAVREWGGRVIAVGTTVVRALETVAAPDGAVEAGSGITSLMVTPERGLHAIDGLVTGWHEPESSHLSLLEAAAGPELLRRSYAAAHAGGYRFHEFGDSHLILP